MSAPLLVRFVSKSNAKKLLKCQLLKSETSWVRCLPSSFRETKVNILKKVGLEPKKKVDEESEDVSQGIGGKKFMSWLYLPNTIILDDTDDLTAKHNLVTHRQLKSHMISFSAEMGAFGDDLAAAHLVLHLGGAVRFQGRERWYQKEGDINPLPLEFVDNLFVDAIDLSNTSFMSAGLYNIVNLSNLRCLNLSNCKNVDDWCLVDLQKMVSPLEILDISGCQQVTDCGVASLQGLRSLKGLCMENMPSVRFKALLTGLLQELIPDLTVRGITEADLQPPTRQERGERRLVRCLLGYFDEVEDLPQEDKLVFYKSVDKRTRKLIKVDW